MNGSHFDGSLAYGSLETITRDQAFGEFVSLDQYARSVLEEMLSLLRT
jgi:hypothetical protein